MHAFWLVLTYDLLGDRRIDDVIIKTSFTSVTHLAAPRVPLFCSYHIWRHLWSITEQKHGNLESIC